MDVCSHRRHIWLSDLQINCKHIYRVSGVRGGVCGVDRRERKELAKHIHRFSFLCCGARRTVTRDTISLWKCSARGCGCASYCGSKDVCIICITTPVPVGVCVRACFVFSAEPMMEMKVTFDCASADLVCGARKEHIYESNETAGLPLARATTQTKNARYICNVN